MTDTDRFEIILRAEGAGPPVAIRLRRWLKAALRGYSLRCVSVRLIEDPVMPIAGRRQAITGVAALGTTFDPCEPSDAAPCEPAA